MTHKETKKRYRCYKDLYRIDDKSGPEAIFPFDPTKIIKLVKPRVLKRQLNTIPQVITESQISQPQVINLQKIANQKAKDLLVQTHGHIPKFREHTKMQPLIKLRTKIGEPRNKGMIFKIIYDTFRVVVLN